MTVSNIRSFHQNVSSAKGVFFYIKTFLMKEAAHFVENLVWVLSLDLNLCPRP